MRYLRAGCGPPLVLLHGLLGYSFSWRFNIARLAQCATIYAVDMPGAGYSERSSRLDCSFRGCAQRLLGFADSIGLQAFDLLGTSHGGAVAMTAAALSQRPNADRIRRLILVAPVNPWSEHGRHLAPFLSAGLIARPLSWSMPHLKFAYGAVLRRLYGAPRRIRAGTLEGYAAPYKLPGSFDYCFRILSTWSEDLVQLEHIIPNISDKRVLLIWGSLDRAVFPDSASKLQLLFCDSELVMLEGVGHLPYEEVPEVFDQTVLEFLTENQQ